MEDWQMSFWGATVITNFLSAIPYIGKDLVELVWGGFSVLQEICGNKTLFNAGKTEKEELKLRMTGYLLGLIGKGLNENNVKKTGKSQPAGLCEKKFSTDSQRLNTEDKAYLVGLIEGDGWFIISKNNKWAQYEMGIELHERDVKLLYKLKKMLGVGVVKRKGCKYVYKIRKKSHLREIVIPILEEYPMLSKKNNKYIQLKENLMKDVIYYEDIIPRREIIEKSREEVLRAPYLGNWLVGFIEAEGCFSVYQPEGGERKEYQFKLCQTDAYELMCAIRDYLLINRKVYVDGTNCSNLSTMSKRGIENVIKFLGKAETKLKGYKRLQYILFLKELRKEPRLNKIKIPERYGKG